MTEPEQWAELFRHAVREYAVVGEVGAASILQRAFEERERELREALKAVEDEGLRNHNTRCRPWWNQVRQALATRQPTPTEGTSDDQ